MAPIIGIGIGINRQYRVVSSGGGPTRTLDSVTVGAFSSGTYPVTLIGDAIDGEDVIWVLYSGTDPTLSSEVAAGTWSGATVVDDGTFPWAASPSPITLVSGIARANYKLVCIVDNGTLSNLVISSAFEVDTTSSLLTSESFVDGGGEDVDWAFTSNEDVSYRVSLWADGSTPSAADIESGTGSVVTVTGSAAATVAETGTFVAVGDGIYVPTIWVSDDYGNEYTETYADVTVAVSDPLTGDAGKLYWFAFDDVTTSGSNVTNVNDKTGAIVDLSSSGSMGAPQKTGSGPIVFVNTAPGDVIQTPTASAAYRRIGQHLRGGGSNAVRMFLVIDASTMATSSGTFFSESQTASADGSVRLGGLINSGNIEIRFGATSTGGLQATSATAVVSSVNAALTGKCIIELHITQSQWRTFIDGVQVGTTGTVTPANFPNPGTARVNLGGIASDTSSISNANGDFYEFYATTTADDTFAASVRSYLTTRHGL